MRCPGCGAEVPAGSTTCPVCGRHLTPSTGEFAQEQPPHIPTQPPTPGGFIPYPTYPQAYPGYPAPGMPPGPYAPPMPPKRNNGWIIALVVVAAVMLLCCGAGCFAFWQLGATAAPAFNSAMSQAGTQIAGTETAQAVSPTPQVILQDPLTTNVNNWQTDAHCKFEANGFHVLGNVSCEAPVSAGPNLDIQVTTQVTRIDTKTPNAYGLALEVTQSGNYYFLISTKGTWEFLSCDANTCTPLTPETANAAIVTGAHAVNNIEVHVLNGRFDFSDNGIYLGTATDNTYTSDSFGLTGGDAATDDIHFSNLTVTSVG